MMLRKGNVRVSNKKMTLKDYMAVNYPLLLMYSKEDKVYFAEFPDLPGCSAHGKTPNEAIKKAEAVKKECIKHLIEFKQIVSLPKDESEEEYSGKFVVRMEPELHRKLVEQAKFKGKSLNRHIVDLLSKER